MTSNCQNVYCMNFHKNDINLPFKQYFNTFQGLGWFYQGKGKCGGEISLGKARTLEDAKLLMTAHKSCSQAGSILMYSEYSYEWGIRCIPPEKVLDCNWDSNLNWKRFLYSHGTP